MQNTKNTQKIEQMNPDKAPDSDYLNHDIENQNDKNQSTENQVDEKIDIRPTTDISESKEAITIISNIPGVEKENLDISVKANILTLYGEYISEKGNSCKKQRVRRCYERQFKIGSDIDSTRIEATIKQGVVSITLPKVIKPAPQKLKINVN